MSCIVSEVYEAFIAASDLRSRYSPKSSPLTRGAKVIDPEQL